MKTLRNVYCLCHDEQSETAFSNLSSVYVRGMHID